MTTTAPTVVLSTEQVTFYHRNGYLVLNAITSPQKVAWLREIYERLMVQRAGREQGNQFDLAGTDAEGDEASLPQILNPSAYAPELKDGL